MANRRDLLSDSVATSERLSTGCEEAGIVLKHQKLEIEVDFHDRKLIGNSELTIVPPPAGLSFVRLNARQLVVKGVEVNGVKAEFKYEDLLSTVFGNEEAEDVCGRDEFKGGIIAALRNGDEGEITVLIPEESIADSIQAATLEREVLDCDNVDHVPAEKYTPELRVKVHYELASPKYGAYFLARDGEHLKRRFPQFYSCSRNGSARCWMPCIDSPAHKCTWEFRIVCPYDLEAACPDVYSGIPLEELAVCEDIGPENLIKFVAVAPGILKSRSQYGEESKILTVYESETLISAADVCIAVATFDYIPIPQSVHHAEKQSEDDPQDFRRDLLPGPYCFFPPYRRQHAAYTMSIYSHVIKFFEQHFDLQIRFPNFKIVFTEDVYSPAVYGAGVVIVNSHLLLQENIIDQFYETITHLIRAIASQWIIYYLFPQTYIDNWLISGLLHYFTTSYLKKLLGLNEFKYRLKKDMIAVCEMDVDQLPLCPARIEKDETTMELFYKRCPPLDDYISKRAGFVTSKSRIVLHMMERRAGNGFMQNLVREILSCAALGKLPKGLSTSYFLETASRTGNKLHVRTFADQWIYGSGCPHFHFSYSFSRKKMLVELKFSQKCTNTCFPSSVNKFTGPFTIRIHEPGGTYDTEVCIEDVEKKFDIQYHTKYKRIRRKLQVVKGKKQQPTQNVTREFPNAHDDSSDKLEWQQEEPARLTFEWIRLDPDCDWLCIIDFEQSDFMWASQLQKDKDVFAQLEAIEALANMPSYGTYNVLLNTMYDINVYYGIRAEAANALAKCVSNNRLYSAYKHIIQTYKDKFQKSSVKEGSAEAPKPNDFTQVQDYLVQKAILNGISYIRGPDGQAPQDCYKLIFSLLKYNDSVNNMLSDNCYVACLITCLGNLFLSGPCVQSNVSQAKCEPPATSECTGPQALSGAIELGFDVDNTSDKDTPYFSITNYNRSSSFEKAISEMQKYRKLDLLVYSYHNTITAACLKVYAEWMKENIITHQFDIFVAHTRYGNFSEIRTMSIDVLLDLGGLGNKTIFEHLLKLMTTDKDPYIRYYLAAKISDKLCDRAPLLSSMNAATPLTVQANRKVCDANEWLIERRNLIKDINVTHYLKTALDSADSRMYTCLFKIMAVLFWAYKVEKRTTPKELPKLKIKMPILKPSASAQLPEDTELFTLSAKTAISIIRQIRSSPSTNADELPSIHEDSLYMQDTPSAEEKFRYILLCIVKRLQNHPSAVSYMSVQESECKNVHANRYHNSFDKISTKIQENFYSSNLDTLIQHIWPIVESICLSTEPDNADDAEYALFFQKVMDKYINVILKCQKLSETVLISKRGLSKVYESIRLVQHQTEKTLSPVTTLEELVPKKPRIKFSVSSASLGESIKTAEQMHLSLIKLCCNVWAEIYKLPESTWFKQDPKDSYAETPNDTSKSDYVDMFTMLKNIFGPVYKSPDMFRDQMVTTTSTLLEKRGIQNPQSIEQILGVKTHFKKSWRASQALYQKQSPTPSCQISITDNALKQGIFADFVIGPAVKMCLIKYLTVLKSDVNAFEFLKPVSKNLYPSYYNIIDSPMDISKIRKNLKSDSYTYIFEFEQDIRLMCRNCYKFNHPTGPVYIQGRLLEKKFNTIWNINELIEYSKQLECASAAGKTQICRPLKITLKSTPKPLHSEGAQSEVPTTPQEIAITPAEPAATLTSAVELKSPSEKVEVSDSKTKLKIKPVSLKASQKKLCMSVMKALQGHPYVNYFLESSETGRKRRGSSDSVNVKPPINLSVIKKKINDGTYRTPEDFKSDFERMMQSFFLLYPPDAEAHQYGKAFEAMFASKYEMCVGPSEGITSRKRSADDISTQEEDSVLTRILKSMSTIPSIRENCDEIKDMEFTETEISTINNFLLSLEKKDYALIFSEPVDPEHLQNYYDVIKNPMDLRTVKERLDNGYYKNLSDFDEDIRLIISNCYKYNSPASYGYDCGVKFEKFYNLRLKQIASTIINRFLVKNIGEIKPTKRSAQDEDVLPSGERRRRSAVAYKSSDLADSASKERKLFENLPHKQTTALKLTLKLRK